MKTLIILRHAKAEKNGPSDFERKLSDEGKIAAEHNAGQMKQHGINPDLIISSPAKRALKTAKITAKILNISDNLIIEDLQIYAAGASKLIKLLRHTDDSFKEVMLVGHNPDLFEMIEELSPQPVDVLRPGDAVMLKFETNSWQKISAENCVSTKKIAG
ncbi:MAG: phosphohistidine phosphatase SixA [Victivallaceae bacterium]